MQTNKLILPLVLLIFPFISLNSQDFDVKLNKDGLNVKLNKGKKEKKEASGEAIEMIASKLNSNIVSLSDGRQFIIESVKQKTIFSNVEMTDPQGAKVELYYDQQMVLSSEIPFLYKSPRLNEYIKVLVNEGNKRWTFKFKPERGFDTVIREVNKAKFDDEIADDGDSDEAEEKIAQHITDGEFKKIIAAMKKEGFDDSRLRVMKSALNTKKVSVEQVIDLIDLFDFANEKVEVGVYCYPKVVDKDQWYNVYSAFEFDNDKEALKEQIDKLDN
ncbi:MAG: DUF4476 domain-containing protein [Calditrichaeota bacterium]|nr:DUF4476 domain-containing protein [Calditrichota bacterium]